MERTRVEGLADTETAKPSCFSLVLGTDMMDRFGVFIFPPHSYYDLCLLTHVSLSLPTLSPHHTQ